ncbi:uncharacterized protein BT62DRAFT_1008219 [Guyanagaster necrorhizus]|uniref:Uncharacterized protein n=1 Tax=Guyanagaster necrorhizus TaxID=856835 RepID=A0A9P7VNP2_9AGAR|nr:uncharacterized protein BT62DRAFT_1008219 [Guyanagaster necrorhizus MCA 3950]KAG7444556.1 hypothetical protein BT62DRAFT_1008219 [Guyanagaster necrorhizus MCA 3950]
MVFIIILLYISATVFLAFNWAYVVYAYIKDGETCVTVLQSPQAQAFRWVSGITSGIIDTDIADTIMIWRCWIAREARHSKFPTFTYTTKSPPQFLAALLYTMIYMYLLFSLGTTLLCTTFIIFRIVTIKRSTEGTSAAARAYRGIVEILVESALL